jgi:hypothetical protein
MTRTLLLGRLTATKEGLRFARVESPELVVSPGDEVELAIEFAYEEPSIAQDRFEATLSIDAAGVDPVGEHHHILDSPFTRERERGKLARRIVVEGPIDGRFELHASLGRGPWSLRVPADLHSSVLEEGTFRLRVS